MGSTAVHFTELFSMEKLVSESRFQTLCIGGLAFLLGFVISAQPAVGYPAGSAVSMGTNPLWSQGGETSSSTTISIPANPESDLIITDIVFTGDYGNIEVVTMRGAGGKIYGKFQIQTYNSMERHISHSYSSGIRIPAGEALEITSSGRVYYSLSGYHAQP